MQNLQGRFWHLRLYLKPTRIQCLNDKNQNGPPVAPQSSSAHLIHTSSVLGGLKLPQSAASAPSLRMGCTLALGGAIPPSSLLQALCNWLTLGFARSSAQLAASLWLHWISWNGSLRNTRLKGSQHFCTAPEFFSTFLESFIALICFLLW